MAEELKQFKEEIVKIVKDESTETRRHFDVVAEGLKHEIQLVAEGVTMANQRIDNVQKDVNKLNNRMEIMEVKMVSVEGKVDKLEGKVDKIEGKVDKLEGKVDKIEGKVDKLANDMEIVKTDVAFIKNELVQKVSREEFTFLEKRVALLENKSNQTK